MIQQDPQEIAISVLAWLADEPDLLGRFLDLSGLTTDTMRQAAREPGFMAGVLHFLMAHEPTLMQYCAASGTRPESVALAHRALAGGGGDIG
ncbi:DUF3572 domain-containing protein [Pseudohoeflea coraliihabitans]|uniref:DUF3572 domain-containing protein n=1 Tax=Pseudohoeflea coraliihabitans TaxID=2860393 RepID=A0ABS6WSJ2_9HYPH|nr:DUF3572 domain-containing protein [Pseudohoeflea sp. DP4N28-3]MBW3098906.1 DUF3572 domain-containing protein [Pseudohoeflea sp. DP4N28-3]